MSNTTVFESVTNQIVKALEAGNLPPWRMGISSTAKHMGMPVNAGGVAYSGINILVLWSERVTKGYASSQWMTYKQATSRGGQVRKGEAGTRVVFYTPMTIKDKVTGEDKKIPMLKTYTVFNTEQCDGLGVLEVAAPVEPAIADKRALQWLQGRGATIKHHQSASAYYMPSSDTITMPVLSNFDTTTAYNAILAHELIHWTGSPTRLDRELGKKYGKEAYAIEELIAEIGAAMVCAQLGIEDTVNVNHVSYVESWLRCLKADSRMIATVATRASKAAQYLMEVQPLQDASTAVGEEVTA